MDMLLSLLTVHSVPQAIFVFSIVIALGLALGVVPIFGIRFGIAGVLFSGLLLGHFQITVDPMVQDLLREFGLILFVYTIGMEVGPSFFTALKRSGIKLNALAVGTVGLGVVMTVLYIRLGWIPAISAVGMFSGASTNTPSLGAIQESLVMLPNITTEQQKLPGLAYSIVYPFGIIGIILSMQILKALFKINPDTECKAYKESMSDSASQVVSADFNVTNRNLDQKRLKDVTLFKNLGVIVSRVMHNDVVSVAQDDTILHCGDIIHAVGTQDKMRELLVLVGEPSAVNLHLDVKSQVIARKIVVTKPKVVGKTVEDVRLSALSEVTITRVRRGGIEFTASPRMILQFADTLVVVGEEESLDKIGQFIGNTPKSLAIPRMLPFFIGIGLGIIVGTIPIHLPGLPIPVRLGMAGGPLVVSIILSRVGNFAGIIWYLPKSANFMVRELGLGLFLAAIGLHTGGNFLRTLLAGQGVSWLFMGASITLIPLFAMAFVARSWLKLNYLTILGLISGSMTNPPALAYANQQAECNATSLAYVTVYPLAMILRILAAQVLVIVFLS